MKYKVQREWLNITIDKKAPYKTLKEFFVLKECRNICIYYLLSMIGFDIIMAIFLFYVGDTLGFNTYSPSTTL